MSISTDKTPIDEIKEYLQFRYNEVYSADLFAPVDYDEVTDKIGGVVLSRISADISRRNALSILEWINENIETEKDAAPNNDTPITKEYLEGTGWKYDEIGNLFILRSGVYLDKMDGMWSLEIPTALVTVKTIGELETTLEFFGLNHEQGVTSRRPDAPRIEDGATLQEIREYAVEQWGGNCKQADAPHPDSPIEEIDAYLTEKNRELYQRLESGDKRKPQKTIIDITDSELLLLLGEDIDSRKYRIDRNVNMGNGQISVNSGDWKWGKCHICLTVKDGILVEAWGDSFESIPISTVAKIVRMGYKAIGFNHKTADAPITPEFLEGLGFTFNDDESVRISSGEGWKVVVHFGEKVTVFAGTKGALLAELTHIRTQSQLVGLIAALFGGGE